MLGGLWVGEVIFLLVLSGYVAGLLIVTARRSPASPAAATIGALGGVALGLTIYLVRPLEGPLHTSSAWLTAVYFAVRLVVRAGCPGRRDRGGHSRSQALLSPG